MRVHNSIDVANELIGHARAKGTGLTPMQLLKLVYLCQGWMLGLYGRYLIDDVIEAWKYGPVIPRLYHAVKDYRGSQITVELPGATSKAFDDIETDLIGQVFSLYGEKSGVALSQITHLPGSPWAQTWEPLKRSVQIPVDLIRKYYSEQAKVG